MLTVSHLCFFESAPALSNLSSDLSLVSKTMKSFDDPVSKTTCLLSH